MDFAAAELRRYLEQILGAELPEAAVGGDGPTIRLSIKEHAGLTDEGYELRAEGSTFRITGGGDLGLVFGTYEFLRRYGGCQFGAMGLDGEYVPRHERIQADAARLTMEPKLWYRGMQFSLYPSAELFRQNIDWMAKNGLNYVLYWPFSHEHANNKSVADVASTDPRTGVGTDHTTATCYTKKWFDRQVRPAVRKRGLKLDMNHHNFLYWLPPARYRKDHPDWYALVDGKRGKMLSQVCICTTNQAAVDTLIENVRTYLRENPEVKIVGVVQEDGYGMCQCKKCVAGDNDPKDAFRPAGSAENCAKSNRYARLLNAVARAIRDEFPDVLVGGSAYVDMVYPPRDVPLEPNTTVWVALYWRDGCRPMVPDSTSYANKRFFDILKQWRKVYRGRLIAYEYYMGMSAQKSLPYPMSEVIIEDWRHLRRLGIEGATVQCRTNCLNAYTLNMLALARSGWYDEVDHAALLDYYLVGAYGSVADEVRPIFERLRQRMRDWARERGPLMPNGDNVRYFVDSASRALFHKALTAAQQKAASDRERRQVQRLSAVVGFWELAAEFYELNYQSGQLAKSDPKAALELLETAINQQWPRIRQYMETSVPPGWLDPTALSENRWCSSRMKDTAAELRKQVSASGSKDDR